MFASIQEQSLALSIRKPTRFQPLLYTAVENQLHPSGQNSTNIQNSAHFKFIGAFRYLTIYSKSMPSPLRRATAYQFHRGTYNLPVVHRIYSNHSASKWKAIIRHLTFIQISPEKKTHEPEQRTAQTARIALLSNGRIRTKSAPTIHHSSSPMSVSRVGADRSPARSTDNQKFIHDSKKPPSVGCLAFCFPFKSPLMELRATLLLRESSSLCRLRY